MADLDVTRLKEIVEKYGRDDGNAKVKALIKAKKFETPKPTHQTEMYRPVIREKVGDVCPRRTWYIH